MKPTPLQIHFRASIQHLFDPSRPPGTGVDTPVVWCQEAGVPLDQWREWAEDPEFLDWLFGELFDEQATKRALRVRLWFAIGRLLDASAPNATAVRVAADVLGITGKLPVESGNDAPTTEDTLALIKKIGLDTEDDE